MKANKILLWRKYGHVIFEVAERKNVNLREAMDIFYNSYTYQEMRIGISDMHCRSEKYLAEEIELEEQWAAAEPDVYNKKKQEMRNL